MEGEWLCYGGGQFNGGRMVILQKWSLMNGWWSAVSMEGEWLLQRWPEVVSLEGE